MKKLIGLIILGVFFLFYSCGDEKSSKKQDKITIQTNSDTKIETPKIEETNIVDATLISIGKKLFKDKTCFTCHLVDTEAIGPSIININKIYAGKEVDIISFLKSESEPIVDTDPGQVAVMKANIDGFVKDLKDEELNALKAYMLSVK